MARSIRVRTIYSIDLLERDGRCVSMKEACSGGTYIRKLCYNIGLYLGVGAHMQELRRFRAGAFTEEISITMLDLYEAVEKWKKNDDEFMLRSIIRLVEEAVKHVPKIYLLNSAVGAVCNGANLAVSGVSKLEDNVRRSKMVTIMTLKGEVVALGISRMNSEEIIGAEEGIAVDTERVIMSGSLYPRIWKHKKHKLKR